MDRPGLELYLFQEYRKAADPLSGPIDHANYSTRFMLSLLFESPDVRVEREVWAYPTISFIADLGGSLSLFVGVSLLSAWDCGIYLMEKFKQQ